MKKWREDVRRRGEVGKVGVWRSWRAIRREVVVVR